jgi:hypothetical protein
MKKVIPFLLLVIFFIAAAWYSLMREPDPVHELPPPSLTLEPAVKKPLPEQAPVVTADDDLVLEPLPLPPLHESDAEVAGKLAEIAGSDAPAQYLVKDQVISRLVAVVDALDARQVPPQINPVAAPEGRFLVVRDGDTITLSEDNASRYDAHVALLQRLDSAALNGMYDRYEPLFQQAWHDNGGEGPFKARLLDIIDHLLAAPEVNGDIYLVKPEAVYLYADPGLETLSAGQKILLRMGPDNAAVVKAKLVELRELFLRDAAYIPPR